MALVKPMQNDVRFATTKDMGRTGITPALFDCILARIADGGMLIHQGARLRVLAHVGINRRS